MLQFIRRAVPPSNGTMYSSLSGRINNPFLFLTNTIHLPSGDTLGKLLLIPLSLAPFTGSAAPPCPSLNGILYRSYWICVSSGELAYSGAFEPAGYGSRALAREYTRYFPSGLQKALVCDHLARSAPGSGCSLPRLLAVPREHAARRVKHLPEPVVLVKTVEQPLVHALHARVGGFGGCNQVLPVGRDLAHEPEAFLRRIVGKRIPPDHIIVADRSVLPHRHQRVQPFVVLRAVHVDAHPFAVARERVAVGARRQTFHHHPVAPRREVHQPPCDERHRLRRQRA